MHQPTGRKTVNRFAVAGPDGRLTALVAEGLPEWPEDLSTVEDAALAELETAFLAEFDRIADDPEVDAAEVEQLRDRVLSLREEAGRRIEAAAATVEDEPTGDDDTSSSTTAVETDPPATETDPTPEDRAARIAAMRETLAPPAPVIEPPEPGVSGADLVAAVAEAAGRVAEHAATAAVEAAVRTVRVRDRAEARADEPNMAQLALRGQTAADLSRWVPSALAPTEEGSTVSPRFPARVVAAADVPNAAMGSEITSMRTLVSAMIDRHNALGRSTGVEDERIPVASIRLDVPDSRDLRRMEWPQAREKILSLVGPDAVGINPFTGREALIASGGLAAPVEPYYPQMVIAQGARPVRDALPSFVADRGGIKLVRPPSIGDITGIATTGSFSDGVTNTDTSLVSATAAFTAADVGSYVNGAGIVPGTRIVSRTNGTTVVLDTATTATATGVTFTISGRNPNNLGAPVGLVTAAQDAAGPPSVIKYTYDVPVGTQAEFDVYSVYTSLQFANLTARTFPEQVEAYLRVADALAARTGDSAMLDVISKWSTLWTGAKTFGTARQLLTQLEHMAALYRNAERMDPRAILRVGLPAWSINAMRSDYLSTFIGGGAANWGLSDDEIAGFFEQTNLMPFLYQDGPTDISQLFATSAFAGATGNGTTLGTPAALPDYPGSGATSSFRTKVISFMWAEGTWLGLTTGELNLGLVRDSTLNSQNRFRNFEEYWETPAYVGQRTFRAVHTVAADGTYGAAASITLGAGSGI